MKMNMKVHEASFLWLALVVCAGAHEYRLNRGPGLHESMSPLHVQQSPQKSLASISDLHLDQQSRYVTARQLSFLSRGFEDPSFEAFVQVQDGSTQGMSTVQQINFAFHRFAVIVLVVVVPAIIYAPGAMAALLYLCVSVCIDLCVAISHQQAAEDHGDAKIFSFNPLCSIICVELGKLIVSMVLFVVNRLREESDIKAIMPKDVGAMDVSVMAAPALFFTLNNLLVFLAIGHNDVSTFGAFRETMILWTALIWTVVFKVPLGWRRLAALFAIMFGLILNQVTPLWHAAISWTVLLVCTMALANACGSVCNEYVLKRRSDLDLNLQNSLLYTWCLFLTVIMLAASDHVRLTSFTEFFHGFDVVTYTIASLQLFAGLLVSRILKHADSLQKNVVAALRSPALVLLAPFLGLQSRSDVLTLMSAVIVGSSAAYFLMQGRPSLEEMSKK